MSKEEKKQRAAKALPGPMHAMPRSPGMPYPGKPKPGLGPYPTQPAIPNPPYTPLPDTQPGYSPGLPYGLELARAYVPIQRFGPLYDYAKALETGTLFPELYRPYPF